MKRLVCITGVGAGERKGHGGFVYDHEESLRRRNGRNSWSNRILMDHRPSATFHSMNEIRARASKCSQKIGNEVLRKVSRAEVAAFVVEELETGRDLPTPEYLHWP